MANDVYLYSIVISDQRILYCYCYYIILYYTLTRRIYHRVKGMQVFFSHYKSKFF